MKAKRSIFIFGILLVFSTLTIFQHSANFAYAFETIPILRHESGTACLGQTRSREKTKDIAIENAIKSAVQNALTLIKSNQIVVDGLLIKDIVKMYSNAEVEVQKILEKKWVVEETNSFKDECFHVRILVKIIPNKTFVTPKIDKKSRQYTGEIRKEECTYNNCFDTLLYFDNCSEFNSWRIPTSKEYKHIYSKFKNKYIDKQKIYWTNDNVSLNNSKKAVAYSINKGAFYDYKNKRYSVLYICDH